MRRTSGKPVLCPFVILIDVNEGHPFTFQGLFADADRDYRPMIVRTVTCSLGRHPYSLGDYSVGGGLGRVSVERKAIEDVLATVLGWESDYEKEKELEGRRHRFEKELENLQAMESAEVVVEGTLGRCLASTEQWGKKTKEENAAIFHRSIIRYKQIFPRVQWAFCDNRRLAEIETFYFLARWAKYEAKRIKRVDRILGI